MRILFALMLVGLPIVDIASLIEVGGRIGVWPTVGLVVLAAVAGSMLMRAQGFSLLGQAQETLAAGRFPAREVFDGLCVLIGGGLLMWPGFVSDVAGLLLLTPPVRAMMRRLIGAQMQRSGRFVLWTANGGSGGSAGGKPTQAAPPGDRPGGGRAGKPGPGPVIDGEFESVAEPATSSGAEGSSPGDRRLRSPWQRTDAAKVVPSDDP